MNDLPQNELLSTYLDGELSPAEKAEVERLLAADPVARRLLDELRAVSKTLQALPRAKLGEDLSQAVLLAAERRKLAEEAPGEAEGAPVPLERSIFRRVFNRRGLAWAGLAVAVAVVISITQEQPGRQQARKMEDDTALNKLERTAEKENGPTSVQAAPESTAEPSTMAPARQAVNLFRQDAPPQADVAETGSTDVKSRASVQMKGSEARAADKDLQTKLGYSLETPSASKPKGQSAPVKQMQQSAEPGQGVLVVQCDISPEAAKKQTFDKLLASNGIVWQKDDVAPVGDEVKQKAEEIANQRPEVADRTKKQAEANQMDFVYVDATPEQVEATLAALASQPGVFANVLVAPAEGDIAQGEFFESGQREIGFGGMGGGMGAQSPMTHPARPLAGSAADEFEPAVRQPALGGEETTEVQSNAQRFRLPSQAPAATATQQRPLAPQLQRRQSSQAVARQQVLFVLRVVNDDNLTPAAKIAVEAKENEAKPAAAAPAPKQP